MAFKGTIEGVISFQKLWNNVLKKTAIVQGVLTTATAAWSFVTKGATLVTKALRLALLSLPFVAIGAAIVGLVSYWDDFVEGIKDGLRWLGIMDEAEEESREERMANNKAAREEKRKLEKEERENVEKLRKLQQEAHNQLMSEIDNEIKLRKSRGEDTIELEREKLQEIINLKKDEAKEIRKQGIENIQDEKKNHEIKLKLLENALQDSIRYYEEWGEEISKDARARDKKALENEKIRWQAFLKEQRLGIKKAEGEVKTAAANAEAFENNTEKEKREKRKKAAEERKKEREKEIAEEKKKAEKLVAIELKRIQDIQKLEDDFRAELEAETDKFNEQFLTEQQLEEQAVQDKYFRLIAMAEQYGENITLLESNRETALAEIRKKFGEEQLESDQQLNQARIESEQALQDAKLGAAKGLIAGLSEVAGENEKIANALFIADKALAIGEIIVNLQREIAGIAATNAILGPAGIPITAAQTIAAKIRAATGIATIAASSIAKFKTGGSVGGAGGGIGGGVPGGGAAPSLQPVTNTSTLVPQDPQQVFVTETDITNTQNKVAVIEDQATIQ
jgi:hypothetical protein